MEKCWDLRPLEKYHLFPPNWEIRKNNKKNKACKSQNLTVITDEADLVECGLHL